MYKEIKRKTICRAELQKNKAFEKFWEAFYENGYSKKENYKIPKIKNAPLLVIK